MVNLSEIHSINKGDVELFNRLCSPNSSFFSDSEAFVDNYIDGNKLALSYNDGKDIFFFGKFNSGMYFFCCPKGKDWQEKLFSFLIKRKDKLGKNFRKAWLWELPEQVLDKYLHNEKFKSIKFVKRKRLISYLPDYKNLEDFLSDKPDLRRKSWNSFFNFVAKQKTKQQISYQPLLDSNYCGVKRLLDDWKKHKERGAEKEETNLVTYKHVYNKNLRIVKETLKNPRLYESFVLCCNQRPIGINIAFKLAKSKNLSGSVLCVDRKIPGASGVLNLFFLEMLANKGYEHLNWGNSFSISIEDTKKRFCPRKQEYSYEYFIDFIN